ncbi:MAG: cysteine--tRNA ligase [Deltaproteobacteria bacterium]|nr:cysteine--tRNA ligase [Deltaproteobacteria bacterium]
MALRVFNSLHRTKEDFVPLHPGRIGLYVCGVTVYDLCHVGHARVYVVFDTIVRWLRRDHAVTYVRNFTDVDDKIIKRAHERGEDPIALAARYADEFQVDMDRLGVARADVEPRVSTHMAEIVAFIALLEDKGFAYRVVSTSDVDGAGFDVYFRVKNMAAQRYLQLSGRNVDDMLAGARVAVDERKEDPLDFALWKSAKPGEVAWDSPFGRGRPGWHIECSAMSKKHLGVTFDLHGGGKDLIFPHHTNEIAQSECAHGEVMARYWLHNGFINFNDEKMAKSVGNFFTIRELWPYATGQALRFFLLSTHYRGDVNFEVSTSCPSCRAELAVADQQALRCSACGATTTKEALRQQVRFPGLEEAERRVQYLYETRRRIDATLAKTAPEDGPTLASTFGKPGEPFSPWDDFVAAMDDDFHTPRAIAALHDVLRVANLLVAGREKELTGSKLRPAQRATLLSQCRRLLQDMGGILGLDADDTGAFLEAQRDLRLAARGLDKAKIEALLVARVAAKANKDFAAADAARADLVALGLEVKDTPEGVEWNVA